MVEVILIVSIILLGIYLVWQLIRLVMMVIKLGIALGFIILLVFAYYTYVIKPNFSRIIKPLTIQSEVAPDTLSVPNK